MMSKQLLKLIIFSLVATAAMLLLYFGVISLLSGWAYAQDQFKSFWYFVTALAVGFGIQVGLYYYLRERYGQPGAPGAVAASGVTGGAAMLACCAHHVVNFLPLLGAFGLATLIAQSQVQLFWVSLLFNAAGLIYLLRQLPRVKFP